LTIVPVAWARAIVALVAFDRLTRDVSSGSTVSSPVTSTVTCLVVSPGANVTDALAAV
jgi:hypothetical protein